VGGESLGNFFGIDADGLKMQLPARHGGVLHQSGGGLPSYLTTLNSCQTYVYKSTIPASLQADIIARQSASDLVDFIGSFNIDYISIFVDAH